jgi:ribosomal protein S18 acetylase RimI-like enzyme
MSSLSATPRSEPGRAVRVPRLPQTIAIALAAAAVGYALHHLPPLDDHLVTGVAISLLAAGAVAVGLRAVGPRRQAYALPTVLVPPPGGVEARALRHEDLDFCAALHADALEHGFFVGLGPGFLRTYYAGFLDSPHAVAFVATVAGHPVGSLVGTLRARAHVRWLIRHCGPRLVLDAAAAMALHPAAALRFLRTRARRYAGAWRRHRAAQAPRARAANADAAVLSHVAILPGARGLGAGRLLVREFEEAARRDGAAVAVLTTLEGPAGAGRFYENLGWTLTGLRRTPDDGRMEEWTRDLSGGDHA